MANIHELPLNSEVLVWREGNTGQPGQWEGLYKLVSIEGKSCVLALPRGNTSFRLTSVKPFLQGDKSLDLDNTSPKPEHNYGDSQGKASIIPSAIPPKRGRGRPRKILPKVTVFLQDDGIEVEGTGGVYLTNNV
jgi:hypothetical protein